MKYVLITLIICICALTNAKVVYKHKQHTLSSVSAGFKNNHLDFNLLSRKHELLTDEKHLITNLLGYEQRSPIADVIKDTLEGFRDIVFNGNDDIPVLDPLHIPQVGPYEVIITGARVKGTIYDFRMTGLGWYIIDEVIFNALRLTFGGHATIPRLTFTGGYNVQTSVLLGTHEASGNYRIIINRLELGMNLRLGTNILGGGTLVLRELNIKIDIYETYFQMDGMTGSNLINNAINAFVNSITQEVVQNQMDTISQILSEELFDIINEILKDFTINDILG